MIGPALIGRRRASSISTLARNLSRSSSLRNCNVWARFVGSAILGASDGPISGAG